MGACFQTMTLPGNMLRNEVSKAFSDKQAHCLHQYGHDPYNGTWSTCRGLAFPSKTFDSVDAACDWIEEHAQKWDNALCVTAKEGGVVSWVIGAWCAE